MRVALMGLAGLASLAGLAGCAGVTFDKEMTPEQMREMVKDKSASVTCITSPVRGGKAVATSVNVDKTSIIAGEVTVGEDCKVTVTNAKPNPVGR